MKTHLFLYVELWRIYNYNLDVELFSPLYSNISYESSGRQVKNLLLLMSLTFLSLVCSIGTIGLRTKNGLNFTNWQTPPHPNDLVKIHKLDVPIWLTRFALIRGRRLNTGNWKRTSGMEIRWDRGPCCWPPFILVLRSRVESIVWDWLQLYLHSIVLRLLLRICPPQRWSTSTSFLLIWSLKISKAFASSYKMNMEVLKNSEWAKDPWESS